jgi:hypothetical protein
MNKNFILQKGDKVFYKSSNNKTKSIIINGLSGETLKYVENGLGLGNVFKILRPTGYKKVYEVEQEILDEEEKKYLSAVIKPFKNRVEYIIKKLSSCNSTAEYIVIEVINEGCIALPYFKKDTMYKGMEIDKEYTLKELGLE